MEQNEICEITCMEVSLLSDAGLFSAWLDRMPESRKRKTASLRHAESQRLSLGVGILLFQAMERRGIPGGSAAVSEGEYGKPFLPEHPEFQFSLSHAGTWALCAVCEQPAGCDAEQTGRGNRRIADRFFHPEEQARLAETEDPREWELQFARLWTRKESYLKATGRGLSLPMRSFSAVSPEKGVWYSEAVPAEGYVFSCCVLGEKEPDFRWRTVPVPAPRG